MTKILLADDHSIIRSALKTIIEANLTGAVVEETADGDSVIESMLHSNFDLYILDINMPGINSVDLINKLFSIKQDARILIFSMNPEIPFAKMYMQLGAMGYLSKTSSPVDIIKAIHTVLGDRRYLGYDVQEDVAEALTGKSINPFNNLSPREFEIMEHMLSGETVKEICKQTGLGNSTISTYKTRIFDKLKTKKIMEIITLAKSYNIIRD